MSCSASPDEHATPTPETPLPLLDPIVVRLAPAEAHNELQRATELRGLTTILYELGLSDLPGVVPRVQDAPPAVGLELADLGASRAWTASLALDAENALDVSLCEAECLAGSFRGDTTWETVALALEWTAAILEREPSAEARTGWRAPPSRDDYAVLLAGRSAATLYGLRPPDEAVGDRRKDTFDRAVYVDPSMAIAAWALSRRDQARGETERARVPLARARAARPWSVVLAADAAALADRVARPSTARAAWATVQHTAPDDQRFVLGAARAALRDGDREASTALLDGLPLNALDDPRVAQLRVEIADANGTASDDLLVRWQEADPAATEPVRRRIATRIVTARYAEALELVAELSQRGPTEEAAGLEVSLSIATGDLVRAREAATRQGWTDRADAVQARIDVESGSPPAGDSDEARVARARLLLARGDSTGALEAIDPVLAQQPWRPEALDVQARCLDGLGRTAEADDARRRLYWVDPDWRG